MKPNRLHMHVGVCLVFVFVLIIEILEFSLLDSNVFAISQSQTRWTLPTTPLIEVTDNVLDNYPDVAYNSQNDEYMVVWLREKSVYGRRVSGRGETIGTEFEIAPSATYTPYAPKIAYDSSRNRYLVIWAHGTGGTGKQLKGRFIPSSGPSESYVAFSIDDTKLVNTVPYALAYALSEDEYLAVWTYLPNGETLTKIVGRRIEADGSGFPAGSFVIAADSTDFRQHPDVGYNLARNEFLVAYDDRPKVDDDVWGTRLTGNGVILGGGEFGIAGWPDEEAKPSVAACGSADQYLVAWHSIDLDPLHDGIYARYIAGDGTPGSVNHLVNWATDWSNARLVDVACGMTGLSPDNPGYLVTWAEETDLNDSVFAREVMPGGSMSDPVEIYFYAQWTAVAGGAINYMVAMESVGIKAKIVGNTNPRAAFSADPTEGYDDEIFSFDASATTDLTDDPEVLEFRWDWENDGTYDTAWTHNRSAMHQYHLESWQSMVMFYPKLQVRDGLGAMDTVTKEVLVRNSLLKEDYVIFIPLVTK